MPDVTCELTDGTTTHDFTAATYPAVLGGIELSPLRKMAPGESPTVLGADDLCYDVRTITLHLMIKDTTLANLETKLRDLEEMLHAASRRWE